jgi:hypothetical protein
VGFAVERRFRLHKVRNVGDVDAQQPVAVIKTLQ